MTPAEIAAIIQLAATLAPPAIEFVNNIIKALDSSGMTGEERMQTILDLQSKLKPMQPIPE
jgi:hypothetical protein